jgi:hypothetical protein
MVIDSGGPDIFFGVFWRDQMPAVRQQRRWEWSPPLFFLGKSWEYTSGNIWCSLFLGDRKAGDGWCSSDGQSTVCFRLFFRSFDLCQFVIHAENRNHTTLRQERIFSSGQYIIDTIIMYTSELQILKLKLEIPGIYLSHLSRMECQIKNRYEVE